MENKKIVDECKRIRLEANEILFLCYNEPKFVGYTVLKLYYLLVDGNYNTK